MNQQREERGEPLYANPRNTGAGSVRQLDPRITASRNLQIWVYSLGDTGNHPRPETHWETLQWLQELGFRVNPNNRLCHTLEAAYDYYQTWLERATTYPMKWTGW